MTVDEIGPVPSDAVAGAKGNELSNALVWFNNLLSRTQRDATTAKRGDVLQATPVADLNQTIAGPSVAEVQAISDKVDELLAALRTAEQLDT
jgi:hypothetical protein